MAFRSDLFCLSEPLPHIHPFVQDADYCYVSVFGNGVEYDVTACFKSEQTGHDVIVVPAYIRARFSEAAACVHEYVVVSFSLLCRPCPFGMVPDGREVADCPVGETELTHRAVLFSVWRGVRQDRNRWRCRCSDHHRWHV